MLIRATSISSILYVMTTPKQCNVRTKWKISKCITKDDAFAPGCRSGTLTCNSCRNPAKSACKSDRATIYETTHCRHQRCQRRDLWRALITGSARCHRYRNASGDEPAARQTLSLETDFSLREVQALADVTHDARDIAASISSGSSRRWGMVILPLFNQNPFRHCP